jgi:hypothetical protein
MFGWILIFALITLLGAIFTFAIAPGPGLVSFKFATIVFGGLFFACIATRIARRHI